MKAEPSPSVTGAEAICQMSTVFGGIIQHRHGCRRLGDFPNQARAVSRTWPQRFRGARRYDLPKLQPDT